MMAFRLIGLPLLAGAALYLLQWLLTVRHPRLRFLLHGHFSHKDMDRRRNRNRILRVRLGSNQPGSSQRSALYSAFCQAPLGRLPKSGA